MINEYFSRHCSLFSLKYTVVRSLRTELFEGLWSRGLPAVGREHTETCEGELGSVGGGEMMIFALSMLRVCWGNCQTAARDTSAKEKQTLTMRSICLTMRSICLTAYVTARHQDFKCTKYKTSNSNFALFWTFDICLYSRTTTSGFQIRVSKEERRMFWILQLKTFILMLIMEPYLEIYMNISRQQK